MAFGVDFRINFVGANFLCFRGYVSVFLVVVCFCVTSRPNLLLYILFRTVPIFDPDLPVVVAFLDYFIITMVISIFRNRLIKYSLINLWLSWFYYIYIFIPVFYYVFLFIFSIYLSA